jgi:hypothetical protein
MAIQSARFLDPTTSVNLAGVPSFFLMGNFRASDVRGNPIGFVAILTLSNGHNQNIEISFDGTTPHLYLLAGEVRTINFRSSGLLWAGRIWGRETSIPPTSGELKIQITRSSQ